MSEYHMSPLKLFILQKSEIINFALSKIISEHFTANVRFERYLKAAKLLVSSFMLFSDRTLRPSSSSKRV